MISVIIPMFNESRRLSPTLVELHVFMKENPGLIGEVVLVDDGSTDKGLTVERAMAWMGRLPLKIIRLEKNKGKWAAIRIGIAAAKYDAVLLLDADGSASVRELETITGVKSLLQMRVAVFGSRFKKGASVEGKTAMRKFISWGYKVYASFWYWFATGRKNIDDMQCPLKLIYKSKIDLDELVVNRFSGDIELACNYKGRIVNYPVQFIHKAGSKLPFSAIFSMAIETVEVAMRYRRSKRGN